MNQLAALAIAVSTLLACVLGLASAFSQEPGSAFTDPHPALADAAREQGLELKRLVGGPTELRSDSGMEPNRTLYVTFGVPDGYNDGQAAYLRDLLEAGGRVVIADNFGHANTMTVPLGISFERVRVVQEEPNITATLGGDSFSLALGEATALHPSPDINLTPVARTSTTSFLDRDGDGLVEGDEPHGPFLTAAQLEVGKGKLLVVSSPALLERPSSAGTDTRAFARAMLAAMLPEGGTVAIDESQLGTSDPGLQALGTTIGALTSPPWIYLLTLASLLVGTGTVLFGRGADVWGAHVFEPGMFVTRARTDADEAAKGEGQQHRRPEPSSWTPRGYIALFGGGFLALAGVAWGNREATSVAAVLLTFAAWSILVRPPELEADREMSVLETTEGVPIQGHLQLANQGRQAVTVEVLETLPATFELVEGRVHQTMRVPSRGTIDIDYHARPAVRGPHEVGPLRVRRRDVLGLRRHERTLLKATTLLVRPRSVDLRSLPYTTRRPTATLGPHMVNRSGDGSEFHSLRDYQQGDSYRNINWKASARSEDFMVNQRVHESMATLFLFVDARRISGAGPMNDAPIVRACRVALSTVEAATKVRDRVHVVLYGDEIREVPPGPRSDQLHELRGVLAEVAARGETTLAEAVEHVRDELKPRTPILVVSGFEGDPTVEPTIRGLRVRGVLPSVVALPVHTRGTIGGEEIEEPGAEGIEQARADTVGALRSRGLAVYDADVDVPLEHLFRLGGQR